MPSSLDSFEEFDRLLAASRTEVDAMFAHEPNDPAIGSIKRQLDALHGWTRGARCPSQAEKDRLNFGLIASRELDTYPVSSGLYELASFVIWWEAPQGQP
jgi:hypothetical protein